MLAKDKSKAFSFSYIGFLEDLVVQLCGRFTLLLRNLKVILFLSLEVVNLVLKSPFFLVKLVDDVYFSTVCSLPICGNTFQIIIISALTRFGI